MTVKRVLMAGSVVALGWLSTGCGGQQGTGDQVTQTTGGGGGDDSGEVTPPADCISVDRLPHTVYEPAGVRVTFRVLSCSGLPVKPLSSSNMSVINDEKGEAFGAGQEGGGASDPGQPSDFALYSILALDMSDSIFNNNAVYDVIDGARKFVEKLVQDQPAERKQRVALMVFGRSNATEIVLDFTNDADTLFAKLEALRGGESLGTTNLYGAYIDAIAAVSAQAVGVELIERSVVILTDGTHEAGAEDELRGQALSSKDSGGSLSVFSIGIKGAYDEEKLRELASRPEYFVLAENAGELETVFENVAARVEAIARSNYVVGVCTPVELGNPSLTIEVNLDGATGAATVPYSTAALTGEVTTCDANLIASPCCLEFEAGQCVRERACGAGALPDSVCGLRERGRLRRRQPVYRGFLSGRRILRPDVAGRRRAVRRRQELPGGYLPGRRRGRHPDGNVLDGVQRFRRQPVRLR